MLIYAATRWLARYRDHGSACGLEAVEQRGRFTRRVGDATEPGGCQRRRAAPPGARLALVKAGYKADDDGLWRLSDSAEAVDRSQVLLKIEEQFQKDIDQV